MLKKWQKWIVSLLACLGLISALSAPLIAKADTTESDPFYERIKKKGVLVAGLSADYPPYEFHAKVGGKDEIVGFDISIVKKIAADMGVKLEIQELEFGALLGALKTEKIDLIISGMARTEEREKEVNFSDSYLSVTQKVVVRAGEKDKYPTVNDFDGVKVGAQRQSTQEELAKKELIGSNVTSLAKVPDLITNLTMKKVDALVLEEPVAKAYIQHNKNIEFADVKFQDDQKEMCVAVSKKAPVLLEHVNQSIKAIQDEGLFEKYAKEANELMFKGDNFFETYGPFYAKGILYTLLMALIGVLIGAILGVLIALMKLSHSKIFRGLAICYIEYVRGTPLLVQVFLVYFGTVALGLDVSNLVAGCIALSLNSAAYVAEIVRSGINAVNKGQTEAARSLGMTQKQAMRFVILPQAVKNILPALGNEFVTVIKESSVISVIGVAELMFQTGNVVGASFKPFLPYVIVSLIYFVLTFTISRLLGVAERRMSTSD